MDHAQADRRHQAMARYLAGDKIEVICRDLHCAKSWLYTWKACYHSNRACKDWPKIFNMTVP
jgi:hypothetical protein